MTGHRNSAHRYLRVLAWLAAAIAMLSSAGCGRNGGNPFASFEARCAKLLPAHFVVTQQPLTYTEDDALAIPDLTRKSGSAFETHRTFGLTVGNFGHETNTELRSVEDRRGARACGVPRVEVALSMQPVTVFIARELTDHPCSHQVTLEHELKHVAAMQEALAEAAARLDTELAATLGTEVRSATSQAALQRDFDTALRDYLSRFMREESALLARRQTAVDSPEEYARVAAACQGEVRPLTGAQRETVEAGARSTTSLYSDDEPRMVAVPPR